MANSIGGSAAKKEPTLAEKIAAAAANAAKTALPKAPSSAGGAATSNIISGSGSSRKSSSAGGSAAGSVVNNSVARNIANSATTSALGAVKNIYSGGSGYKDGYNAHVPGNMTNWSGWSPGKTGSAAGSGLYDPLKEPTQPTQPQTVEEILSSMGGEDPTYTALIEELKKTATEAPDEAAIRKQKEAEYQAQLDSIQSLYADRLNQSRVQGQGRMGSNTAMQARGGLLGSDFGAAQTSNVQAYNTQQENVVENEKAVALNTIFSAIRSDTATELAAKQLAKQEGAKSYLEYLQGEPARKQAKHQKAAQILLSKGVDPKTVSDAELKKLGLTRDELTMVYNELKSTTESAAKKSELETAKTQAEIAKLQQDAANGKLDANKYYEVGNKIYERGTNKYIADAVFNPNNPFQVTPGNSVYNPVTNTWSTAPTSTGTGAAAYQGDPNTRAGRHNNPTAFTTDVARTGGLVEGVDYVKGDPFQGGDGRTYYTARLLGNAVDKTITTIDNYVARGSFPGWTYANKIGLTPEAWKNADYNTKVGFLQKMQVEEGGKGQFTQGTSQDGTAQFDPIKGPQYEQYNSKGVVPKGVDPNTFKQEALAYKQESIGREATKYIDSIDKLLATKISRNERLAINTAPSLASIRPEYADVINAFNNIISKLNIKSLTDAKAQGATFGQLSNQELKVLGDAATSLKLNSSDAEWKKQIAIIGNALLKASGQAPKYDESGTNQQTPPENSPAPSGDTEYDAYLKSIGQ